VFTAARKIRFSSGEFSYGDGVQPEVKGSVKWSQATIHENTCLFPSRSVNGVACRGAARDFFRKIAPLTINGTSKQP